MADQQEEDDLQMALRISLQAAPPEAKRSKPPEDAEESPEARGRRLRREIMAAAAERRIAMTRAEGSGSAAKQAVVPDGVAAGAVESPRIQDRVDMHSGGGAGSPCAMTEAAGLPDRKVVGVSGTREVDVGEELRPEDANQLFFMLFGSSVSKDILLQWTNQGIRFSTDPDTCMGLVQHEGGPCGILAPIQAFVLKYLLFFPKELDKISPTILQMEFGQWRFSQSLQFERGDFSVITELRKTRALVLSMVEILFLCGDQKRATVATLNVFANHTEDGFADDERNEMVSKALEGLSIESPSDLLKYLRVSTHISQINAYNQLIAELPVFQSRMGAMLFLISALLSRGLESIQADRDDPNLPLVTAPFGHASQEIVNLLICGEAVPNVFDGRMELGGSMSLKGIPGNVEVGFLTLLESLNFCKVGQFLKCPRWPIWVVGSESHYTVLFAPDTTVQDENELEERESKIRAAFDTQDQSGGGGFISVEGFHQVLKETNINMPSERINNLCSTGYIVWSEFWQALLELDRNLGGMKDSTGLMGKKQFDIYHFNGIAKSVSNGAQSTEGEAPLQRPRLSKLHVSVPPKWTQEEFMTDVASTASSKDTSGKEGAAEVNQRPEPSQHAPLVDCVRTRWPRATCTWVGDPPSIV
uniref:ubiquitinyl hydrolase 1 n=1 Tax=Anthurium amnicola TaxID=1678845 RepID=A0A1D1XMK2_9ARAE